MDDEELANYPGLKARNGVWYVRKRVPLDLAHVEPRSSIRISLETTEKRRAVKLYPFKMAEIEMHFAGLRNRLQSADRASAALATGKLERLSRREIEGLVSDWWTSRLPARQPVASDPTEVDALIADIEEDARAFAGDTRNSEVVCALSDSLLVSAGMAAKPHAVGSIKTQVAYPIVDRTTPSYRYLCELVGRALTTEAALAKDHLLARREASHDPLFNPADVRDAVALQGKAGRRLPDLLAAYKTERAALRGATSTDKKYGFPCRVMEEVLGRDKIVSTISRADCIAVRSFLERLPPNATKRFPGLSLTEIAERADAENLDRLAPNSVGSYMQSVLAVLRWAEDEGWGVKINQRDLVGSREPLRKRGLRAAVMRLWRRRARQGASSTA